MRAGLSSNREIDIELSTHQLAQVVERHAERRWRYLRRLCVEDDSRGIENIHRALVPSAFAALAHLDIQMRSHSTVDMAGFQHLEHLEILRSSSDHLTTWICSTPVEGTFRLPNLRELSFGKTLVESDDALTKIFSGMRGLRILSYDDDGMDGWRAWRWTQEVPVHPRVMLEALHGVGARLASLRLAGKSVKEDFEVGVACLCGFRSRNLRFTCLPSCISSDDLRNKDVCDEKSDEETCSVF